MKLKTAIFALAGLIIPTSAAYSATLIIELTSGKRAPRDVFAFIPSKCTSTPGAPFKCKKGAKEYIKPVKDGKKLIYTTKKPGWGFCIGGRPVNCWEPGVDGSHTVKW
jgi:hypothetical protein